ncbi:hypothetical protein B0H13DRAFT_2372433 [Mycena leptocephala]|nr:hypothetical protein B0H13DRAFT_2372433 [Mycena leptocephala]
MEHGYAFFASHPPHLRLLIAHDIARSSIPHIPPTSDVFRPILPPLEPTQFWVRTSAILTALLNAHLSRLARRLLRPLRLTSPTLNAYKLPRMRARSFPANCSGRPVFLVPHIATPYHLTRAPTRSVPPSVVPPACVYRAPWPPLLPRSPRPFRGCITLRDELTPLHSLPAPCRHLHIRRSSATFSQCTRQKPGSAVSRSVRDMAPSLAGLLVTIFFI